MQMFSNRNFVMSMVCITISGSAFAENGLEATLGAGVLQMQSHVKGEKSETEFFPMVELSYGGFSLSADGLGYTYELSPLSAVFFSLGTRNSTVDGGNLTLSNLTKRDDATEVGVAWIKNEPMFELTTYLNADISNTHKGFEVGFDLGKPMMFAGGYLTPSIGVNYLSEDLVNYYYGVSSSEASNGIKSYDADGSLGANLGLEYVYKIYSGWHSYTAVSWDYLGSGVGDSSIVERDSVWSGIIGIVYEF
ncbi:MipA/OmpV family protein [Marinomonas balearica]|uniref:Outer membrane protein n=1 Tax=Marinomonas balearica TaxID=491947 RepID=A0A4R6MAQ7_9GAMM|nr:MipA/OmpV family protein [Marinomonas balearica]TDO98647.1 outer membrane protein [Marinomonas balearica]